MRVLIADDSPVALAVLERALTNVGATVLTADSVAAATRWIDDAFDCAVLDLDLGDGTGVDLARALLERAPSIKIAFFTAHHRGELYLRAEALGPVFPKNGADDVARWVVGVCQLPG